MVDTGDKTSRERSGDAMTVSAIADLVERLGRLEDERAILGVLHRFTHCIDYGRERDFVALFTEDGVFEVRRRNGETARREGHEELLRFMKSHTRAPGYFHKHLLLSPVITLDGNAARAESYWALLDEQSGGPFVKSFGRYRDHLTKDGGEWRIRERKAEVEVRAPDYAFSGEAVGGDRPGKPGDPS
jgi:hypothetical protein